MNTLRNKFFAVCAAMLISLPGTMFADVVTVANPDGNAIYSTLEQMGLNFRTVDSLKVTGTVSEADFKLMNNAMIALAWIDLSGTDITRIPDEAFMDCQHITDIMFPTSVTAIGDRSFRSCYNLKTVTGFENVQFIGSEAFNGDGLLSVVPFADKIQSIKDHAFWCSAIEGNLVFPDCFNSIETNAFGYTRIRSVDLSRSSVKYLGWGCFRDCYWLENVSFPENGQFRIEGESFWQDTLLTNIFIPSNLTYIGERAFSWDWDVDLHRTITMQGNTPPDANANSFYNKYNEKLTLNVPSGSTFDYITSRGFSVFGNTNELGYSVNFVGKGTISVAGRNYANGTVCFPQSESAGTTFLITPAAGYDISQITFNGESVSLTNNMFVVNPGVNKGSLQVTFAVKSLNISISKNSGGTLFFDDTPVQNGVVLPVSGGESYSFSIKPDNGYFIKSLKFNGTDCAVYNGQMVFNTPALNDNSTVAVEFGTEADMADYIKVHVNRSGYGTIMFNGNPVNTDTYLLVRKNQVSEFTFQPGTEGSVQSLVVNSTDVTADIADNTYTLANQTQNVNLEVKFFSVVDVMVDNPNGALRSILSDQGMIIRNIKNLKLTGNVTDGDFSIINSMQSLENLDLSETNITEIPYEAFRGNNTLKSVALPLSCTLFGDRAFFECHNLVHISGYDNIKIVRSQAFAFCNNLVDLPFGNQIKNIDSYAFEGSERLPKDIIMPATLETLGSYAFNYPGINSIDLSQCSFSDVLGWHIFENTNKVILPDKGQYNISSETFSNSKITSLVIPASVAEIRERIFEGATRLNDVYMRSLVPPRTDSNPFGGNYMLMTLHVPAGSLEMYSNSPHWCNFGNIVEYGIGFKTDNNGQVYVNGNLQPGGQTIFPDGNDISVSLVPAIGYDVASVTLDGTAVAVTNNEFTLSSSVTTGSLQVNFAPRSLNVTVNKSNGGTLKYNGNVIQDGAVFAANGGESLNFSLEPADGGFIKSIKFNGADCAVIDGVFDYSTPALYENSTVAVEFGTAQEWADYIKVKINRTGFGAVLYNGTTINTGSSIIIRNGESPAFAFEPGTNGYVKTLKVNSYDMTSSVADNAISLGNLAQNVNMEVVFFSAVDVWIDNPNGRLKEKLNEQDITTRKVRNLKLTGRVAENDFATIKTMQNLIRLDLSETNLTEIPNSGLYGMSALETLNLPLTLVKINEDGVRECHKLTTVTGFENIARLEHCAFWSCERLENFPFGNKIECISSEVFEGCNSLPKNIVMYPSLKEWGGFAFSYEGINTIDLSQCTFENTSFNWYPFSGAKNVILPEKGNYSLDYLTFHNLQSKSIVIPVAVTYISREILSGDTQLRDIYMRSAVPPSTDGNPFGSTNLTERITLHVPTGSAEEYESTPYWSDFGQIVEYGIGIKADNHGAVYVNGAWQANESAVFSDGNDISVRLVPASGYEVGQVLLDGNPLVAQSNGTYTIPSSVKNGIITIKWAIRRFGITVNYSGSGSVMLGGRTLTNGEVVMADSAQVIQFDMAPAGNNLVKNISFNGVESVVQNGGTVYITPAINSASTLNVVFAEQSGEGGVYPFSITTGGNGTVSYRNTTLLQETSINIGAGEQAVFEFNPQKYYKVAQVIYNGADVTQSVSSNRYVVNSVNQAATLSVGFELDTNVKVALTTPGTLGMELFQELRDTVEYLTVSGPVNENDFDVIRQAMPHLKVLDITGVQIDYMPDRAFSTEAVHYMSSIRLPQTISYISCESFRGIIADTIIVNSVNTFDLCDNAFDSYAYYHSIVLVPLGKEQDYLTYSAWPRFINLTDGVLNRNGEVFVADNIKYKVSDFDNRKVEALLTSIDDYESLPQTVQAEGLTFTVQNANLITMDSQGYIQFLSDGSVGPWQGKYLYSNERIGESWKNGPSEDWMDPDYDDSEWTPFLGPLSRDISGYSQWNGENDCYWIRRELQLDEVDFNNFKIRINMDDEISLYINGTNVYNGGSNEITVSSSCLKVGRNVIAARGINTGGPAVMDFSFNRFGLVVDGLTYEFAPNSNREVVLTGTTAQVRELYVPASISFIGKEYNVTGIADNAFFGDTVLTRVTGLEKIKSIGWHSFEGCTSLSEFSFPAGLSSLGGWAFYDCTNLNQSVVIPSTVFGIGERAFENSGIVSASLSCTEIGYRAFANCRSMEQLVLNEGVKNIWAEAFLEDASIVGNLILPSTLTYMEDRSFYNCKGISSVAIPAGLKRVNHNVFGNCNSLTNVIFNEGLQVIDSYAFYNTQIVELNLPTSLREIGDEAFAYCNSLTAVSIKNNVTSIGNGAFWFCGSLKSIEFPSSVTRINDYVCRSNGSLEYVKLPDNVTYIGYEAFQDCRKLTEIDIPVSLKTLSDRVFADCDHLVKVRGGEGLTMIGNQALINTAIDSITIPQGVKVLKPETFRYCNSLVYVRLPENLVSIGSNAFRDDPRLSDINIPESVTSIEYEAFFGCGSLSNLTIPASVTSIGENALRNIPIVWMNPVTPPSIISDNLFDEYTAIVVPSGSYDTYRNAMYWSSFKNQYTMIEDLDVVANVAQNPSNSDLAQVLGEDKLAYIVGLKVIGTINSYDIMVLRNKMPLLRHLDLSGATIVANDYEYYEGYHTEDNVIGDNSFRDLNLSSVILPVNAERIGNNAFFNCRYLQSVEMFDHLQSIGSEAFSYCYLLKNVVIPDSVETIGHYAFNDCGQLTSVFIGDGVQTIEAGAFIGCGSLTDLRLGKNLLAIGSEAFRGCRSLKIIDFGKKLKFISNGAFAECNSLTDVILPPNLIEISEYAFAGCSQLKQVKISSSVKYIRNWAFDGCPLERVYTYTIEPTNINQNTFSAYKTASLYVPSTSYYNYYLNTQWSQFLELVEFDEPYDFFYLNGDYDLDDNTGRIAGVPDMEMNQTSGITVEGNDVQEISAIELNYDYSNENEAQGNDAGPSIIAGSGATSNGVSNLTAKSMDVNIGIDGNRWYFFCFPFDLNVDSIDCTAEYVVYKYDGLKRSRGLSGWTKLDNEDKILTKGNGYIFQASFTSMLTIHVATEYLSFAGEIENQPLNTYISNDLSNASWNFVGNPFISYYDIQDLSKEYDAPIAVWNGYSYDVYKPGDDNYQLKPFEAFFVQKGNDQSSIQYLPDNRITYNTSKTRMSMYASQRAVVGTPMAIDRQLVNIVIMNSDSLTDRTRIVYSTKASREYEIGVDAAKFQAEGVPQIYTLNGTVKYAINERPMADDDIRIGFCAPTDGTYTLSVARQDADVAIYDKEAGKYVDFTFGDYSFETKAGTFNDRFVIHRTGGVTAVENGFKLDGLTVTTFDGGLDIEGRLAGKITVYTESGMLVAEPTQTGRLLLSDGVYIVKIGEKSVKITVL